MASDLDEPDIELDRGRAYEVLVRMGDVRDPRQALIPNFAYVHAQPHQRLADFTNLVDSMQSGKGESNARFDCHR